MSKITKAYTEGLKAKTINIKRGLDRTEHWPNRTPESSEEDSEQAFVHLADYRDGGVFVANYAGNSEWERHGRGDEFVQVIEGETCLVLLIDGKEQRNDMRAGELLVVPQGIWHRFESPNGVKALTITPQPTDHSTEFPPKVVIKS